MSTADLRQVLRNPGRLVLNPTDLSASFPYGGAELGRIRRARVRWGYSYEPVIAEEWGEAVEHHVEGARPFLAVALEQWDDDVLALAFPSLDTASSLAGRVQIGMKSPLTVSATNPILFAPHDPAGKALYIRRPVVCLEESAETRMALDEIALFPLVIYATRDSAYATTAPFQCAPLDRIAL